MTPPDSPSSEQPAAFSLEDATLALFWMIAVSLLCALALTLTDWTESTRGMAGSLAVEAGILLGMILILRRKRIGMKEAFGLEGSRWPRAVAAGLIGCLIMLPVTLLLSAVTTVLFTLLHLPAEEQPALQWILQRKDLPFRILFFFQAALAAPFVEELFFRGILIQGLRSRFSLAGSIVASSLLFSLFHFHPPALLPLFALGAGFAAVCLFTRSLAAAWVMHAAYNIVNLVWVLDLKG